MRFLLDSDALLGWMSPDRFDRGVRGRIERLGARVSAASAYELGNKTAAGKLRMPLSVIEAIEQYGFASLPITLAHAAHAARLPQHHRDPFDRLLIAQSQLDSLTIVSRDEVFDAYDVDVVRF